MWGPLTVSETGVDKQCLKKRKLFLISLSNIISSPSSDILNFLLYIFLHIYLKSESVNIKSFFIGSLNSYVACDMLLKILFV